MFFHLYANAYDFVLLIIEVSSLDKGILLSQGLVLHVLPLNIINYSDYYIKGSFICKYFIYFSDRSLFTCN